MAKNLLLFFGSGISFLSGLPNTDTITDRLLNEKWHTHTDQNFYSGEHPNPYYREIDITPRIQRFLTIEPLAKVIKMSIFIERDKKSM